MICPACQLAHEADARFCEQCGHPLEISCPACGSVAKAGVRFCRRCGQNLAQPAEPPAAVPSSLPTRPVSLDEKLAHLQRYLPPHITDKILANRGRLAGERKLVTVLFADLAGYTTLSEQLGEEALFALMDELYERLIHEIHRYEGTVNELTGDGLVAFFGAPLAVEQAPQRAVRAALALQDTVQHFSSRLVQARGEGLHLRVGINTGPVIVGSIGNDLRMDYKAIGNTVNLAARMEQTAAPGTVQITEHTYKLITGYFDCDDLGLVSLKGLASKVRIYRVTGEHTGRTRIDVARERGFTRLVGRQRELEHLRHCFDLAQSGRGQAVSIIGDAGLGKSRLLYEFRQTLASRACFWLDGRCHPYGTALAYGPIVEMLKQRFQLDVSDQDEDIQHKVHHGLQELSPALMSIAPYLLHLLAVETAEGLPADLAPEAIKHRIFEALRGLLDESAAQGPVVLALEDLHWIDAAAAEFLTFLLDNIAGTRVLLVCTYRPDFVSTWSRKSYHSVLTLTPLGPPDGRQMLTAVLGTPHIQNELATLVLDKAEGIPFFLEELVHALQETGAIELHAGQWRLTPGSTGVSVPNTVEEVLMARIDRLPEGAKLVLQVGAVIGREFSGELLRQVAGLPQQDLTAHLAALTEAELLYVRGLPPHMTYLFKHALTQEAAYRSLLTAQRQELHHRVAVTLEALFPDRLEEHYGSLAHHFLAAAQDEEVAKAIEYAVRAGERNMALPAYAEAVRFYTMALEALARQDSVDEAQRGELLLALGKAQRKAGEYVQALETLQRAADSARQRGSSADLARVALEIEQATLAGRLAAEPAVRLLEAVLLELGAEDSALQASVLGALARALLFSGTPEQAAAYAQQAVDVARHAGDPGVLAFALHSILHLPWWPEETEARLTYATEMLQLAEAANNEELVCNAHNWRLIALLELGDVQAVDTEIAAYGQAADRLQEPIYPYSVLVYRTMRAILEGRFAEAERLAQQALAIGQRLQTESVDGTFGIQMFTLCRERGGLKELEPAVRQFVRQHGAASAWRPGLALIYSELGREREARLEFEHLAQHDFADLPHDTLWVGCMTYLTEVCAFLGDAARAATLYQLLLPHASRAISVGGQVACYGAASRYLGMLATTMERWEDAERHFQDALATNARMGARPWLAHTQHQYARMLQARNQSGDREKAVSLLDEALATARDLGMHALAGRITGQQEPTISPAPMPQDLPDALSPREIEVLRLIAAGKSNRDVADALYISLNTVATHVRNILTKTGCTNRTEAAAYALRHGLPEG